MTAGRTANFGLSKMSLGDEFPADGYKHLNGDRDSIDTLLYVGTTGHKHTGATAVDFAPELGPNLSLDTGGIMHAGRRVYYKITYVDDRGIESAASPEVYIDTAAAVSEPGAPTLAVDAGVGALTGGTYYYALSAYVGSSTEETRALSTNSITLSGTANTVTLTLPSVPTGADGFNIFRRAPGERDYRYLASTTVATTYADDGTVDPSINRGPSRENVTNNTNAIVISLAGATPSLPDGFTWKIYRTFINGGWDNTFLVHVLDDSTTYTDVGLLPTAGKYPEKTILVDDAEKIDLGTETTGSLRRVGAAGLFPFTVEFHWSVDPLATGFSTDTWVCEYPNATFVAARGTLGYGGSPASQEVLFDCLMANEGATPTYVSIFASATPVYPKIEPHIQRGERLVFGPYSVDEGDVLVAEVTQTGGGATPTDRWATLILYGVAWGFPTDIDWNATTGAGLIP